MWWDETETCWLGEGHSEGSVSFPSEDKILVEKVFLLVERDIDLLDNLLDWMVEDGVEVIEVLLYLVSMEAHVLTQVEDVTEGRVSDLVVDLCTWLERMMVHDKVGDFQSLKKKLFFINFCSPYLKLSTHSLACKFALIHSF